MNTAILTAEFEAFTQARLELERANAIGDANTARLALEEIEGIGMYTEWPRLRDRCAEVKEQFAKRQAKAEPTTLEITNETGPEQLDRMLATLRCNSTTH